MWNWTCQPLTHCSHAQNASHSSYFSGKSQNKNFRKKKQSLTQCQVKEEKLHESVTENTVPSFQHMQFNAVLKNF